MAIQSANTIGTTSLAELVAVRAAEAAGYLTVGSKKYLGDQLKGKRNGQDYRFVIRDVAEAVNSLSADPANQKTNIVEREVTLSLDPWHILVETNAIEKITDLKWDDEIAKPNATALINKFVKKVLKSDIAKVNTAFVGFGFGPMSRAGAYIGSITDGERFGFCDPNVEAILTSNGQMFTPVNAPDMYAKGLLGKFHMVDYRAQRFFPTVKISETLKTQSADAYIESVVDNGDGTWTMNIAATTLSQVIPAGLPIFVDDVFACDLVGEETSNLACFVVMEDATPASNKAAVVVSAKALGAAGVGTREINVAAIADFQNKTISIPEAGTYFMGLVRAEGAEEFETLDELDAAGADYEKVTIGNLSVHQNRIVDLVEMSNKTRFDIVGVAGLVDGRAASLFYIR